MWRRQQTLSLQAVSKRSKRSKRCVCACVCMRVCVVHMYMPPAPLEHQIHPFAVKFPAYRLHIHVHTTIDQIRNPLCSYTALLKWLLKNMVLYMHSTSSDERDSRYILIVITIHLCMYKCNGVTCDGQ